MSDKVYVPLDQSGLPEIPEQPCRGLTIDLPGDRSVSVGICQLPEKHVLIRIESLAPEGKVALTQFGLRMDAAKALLDLLKITI